MLRYYRVTEDSREEITHDKALQILLGVFRDNDMTRDMLTTVNRIPCRYSMIEVEEEIEGNPYPLVLMPGLSMMAPMGAEYDDNGKRIA